MSPVVTTASQAILAGSSIHDFSDATAAVGLRLFDAMAASSVEAGVDLLQFVVVLDLDAEIIWPSLPATS